MIERIKLGTIQNNTHFIKSFLTHTERVFFFFWGGGGGCGNSFQRETIFKISNHKSTCLNFSKADKKNFPNLS